MNKEKLFTLASSILNLTPDIAKNNSKSLPEIEALYVWNPQRGGGALIISNDETFLYANSSISFDAHIQAFLAGKRTNPESFY